MRSYTDPSPAARLRRYLRATGLPPVLPEWGYGFWKSRDVYPHQDDVEDDVHGCQRNGIPLDAVVLDSPWETQYNTWEPNPHQFTDFAGMVRAFRADGNAQSAGGEILSRKRRREPTPMTLLTGGHPPAPVEGLKARGPSPLPPRRGPSPGTLRQPRCGRETE